MSSRRGTGVGKTEGSPTGRRLRSHELRYAVVIVVCCLLVIPLAASVSGLAAGSGSGHAAASASGLAAASVQEDGGLASVDVDPDDVLMEVHLQEDGSAEWKVEYRVRLDDDDETAAFESLMDDVEEDPEEFESRFRDRMNETARSASEATLREMEIGNVTVTAEIRHLPQQYGVVTYLFDWHGFATVSGDELVAGDAIGGLFLDEQTSLLVRWPEGFWTVTVDPEPHEVRSSSVVWRGPIDFGSGEPTVVVTSDEAAAEPVTATPEDESVGSAISPLSVVGTVVGLLVLAGGALAWRYSRDGSLPGGVSSGGTGGDGGTGDGTGAGGGSGASSGGRAGGDGEAGGGDGATAAGATDLLSNEERVLSILESNGGRMKQQEIVAGLGWTEAKTSQVISGMREEGTIEGFRLGRENVISLPNEEDE